MQVSTEFLQHCVLFDGIRQEDRTAMLGCLGAKVMDVRKNQVIFQEGDAADTVGIVLKGSVQMIREDYYGNRSIVARIEASGLFGESFACSDTETYPVSIVAAEDSRVMLIASRRITTTCCNACEFHNRMIFNMLKLIANNNLTLTRKIEVTSKRTTREKLLTYLNGQAKAQNSDSFSIPYDRQGLADYLEVERSAMSAEISKLRRDGIIEAEKNRFRLLKPEH